MRHRPRGGGALELHEDRGGLRMADPDRQELVSVLGLEQHDRLLSDHVERDPVDDHLLHLVHGYTEFYSRRLPALGVRKRTKACRTVASPSASAVDEMGDPGFEPGTSALSER